MTAAQKRKKPLIRYAGSATETSIGSKPIGSELIDEVYRNRQFCQPRLTLPQSRVPIFQPGTRQTPRTAVTSHKSLLKMNFLLFHACTTGQIMESDRMRPQPLVGDPPTTLKDQQRDTECQH